MNKKFKKVSTFTRHEIPIDDFRRLLGIKDEIEDINTITHVYHGVDSTSRAEFVEITTVDRLTDEV